jgi:hypothetical protein
MKLSHKSEGPKCLGQKIFGQNFSDPKKAFQISFAFPSIFKHESYFRSWIWAVTPQWKIESALSKILSKQFKIESSVEDIVKTVKILWKMCFFRTERNLFIVGYINHNIHEWMEGRTWRFFGLFSHHLQSFSTLPAPLLSSRKKSLQKLRPEENRKLIPGKRIQDFFCLFFKSHFSRSRTDAINIRQIINLCPVLLQCRISLWNFPFCKIIKISKD